MSAPPVSLICPTTGAALTWWADEARLVELNLQIRRGAVDDEAGQPVRTVVDGLWMRPDGTSGYPSRRGIATLLPGSALMLPTERPQARRRRKR